MAEFLIILYRYTHYLVHVSECINTRRRVYNKLCAGFLIVLMVYEPQDGMYMEQKSCQ